MQKGEAMMEVISDTSWGEANIEVIKSFLKKEFENFAIAHRADQSRTHTFTVENGKKRFTLLIGWPILVDRRLTHASMDHLLKEHVAEEMRLHGKEGYHWTPSNQDMTQCAGLEKNRVVGPIDCLRR